MARWLPPLGSAMALVGTVIALRLVTPVAAQTAEPCRPGASLLSLGKAAFFRAVERAAFAIGERTLDDLTDGLGMAPGQTPSRSRRSRPTAPAQARATVLPPPTDSGLVDALQAYVRSPSSEAADAALSTFLRSSTKILFETPPEKAGEMGHVGLGLEGGEFLNRSSAFAVEEMADESRRRQLEFSRFGDGPDLKMGGAGKVLSEAPFFRAPTIADGKNLDRNNLGIEVTRDQDLRTLWFEDYRDHLAAFFPNLPPAQLTAALDAGWPILQRFWAFKRTEMFVLRAQEVFGTEMREVNERVTDGDLPARDCEPGGR